MKRFDCVRRRDRFKVIGLDGVWIFRVDEVVVSVNFIRGRVCRIGCEGECISLVDGSVGGGNFVIGGWSSGGG